MVSMWITEFESTTTEPFDIVSMPSFYHSDAIPAELSWYAYPKLELLFDCYND